MRSMQDGTRLVSCGAMVASFAIGCGGSGATGAGGSGSTATSTAASMSTTTTTASSMSTTSTTSTSSSMSTGSTSSGTGGGTFTGSTNVAPGDTTAVPGSADVAISPDGTIFVSWVDTKAGGGDVYVARSVDGGASFDPGVKLDDASVTPLVSMARHPYVVADDKRVAVAFNDSPGNVYLYVSQSKALSFGAAIAVGGDITTNFRDFPKPFFLPGGELSVAWHGFAQTGARIYVGKESANFASVDASGGAPGVPCECCPLDVLVTSESKTLLGFRNNDNNTREMWSASGDANAVFGKWSDVSTTEGTINACPMQGPRMIESAGEVIAVWSVRGSSANAGQIARASTTDGGATWSASTLTGVAADEPTIALGAGGKIYMTGVTGNQKSVLTTSTDGGKTFTAPMPLQVGDGTLGTPQIKSNQGVVALAGVSLAGSIWLERME